MLIAGTGHRPNKLGGYSDEAIQSLEHFAYYLLHQLRPEKVISGMALGWDQSLALAAIQLEIPLIAAVPCKGQESQWPTPSQARYNVLLGHAERVEILADSYSQQAMQNRNKWMVDQLKDPSDYLLALWNGTSGGTGNCIKYAEIRKVHILNVWDHWQTFLQKR